MNLKNVTGTANNNNNNNNNNKNNSSSDLLRLLCNKLTQSHFDTAYSACYLLIITKQVYPIFLPLEEMDYISVLYKL